MHDWKRSFILATLVACDAALCPRVPAAQTANVQEEAMAGKVQEFRLETGADIPPSLTIEGLPDGALLALTWVTEPLRLVGVLTTSTTIGPDGKPVTVSVLDPTSLSLVRPAPGNPDTTWEKGLIEGGPYGTWLRRASGDPLRLGGPLATFLGRLSRSRRMVGLRGFQRSGTFLVVEIDLCPEA